MKKYIIMLFALIGFSVFSQVEENEIIKVSNQRELALTDVSISPNPSPDLITITAPKGAMCQIVSMKGTYVGTWEISENGKLIEELGKGTYVALITKGGQSVKRRFVIY
ncbi:MAG: T9SS type A sorting domain-containing protein [Crocinitomicaceae bacterium]|nr:T9SS type A sorting domain-containing protein [Crocinitomicaceae bacterium]